MTSDTLGAGDAIAAYLRAKDENRPYLMRYAFDEAATLEMVVKTDAISFPPSAVGRETLTELLVREFGRTYENVRTFCLSPPPQDPCAQFSCGWLVAMSAKQGRMVRVGWGRYDWTFGPQSPRLARGLAITIEGMQVLPPENLLPVMAWVQALPYPWCPVEAAARRTPELHALEPMRAWLSAVRQP